MTVARYPSVVDAILDALAADVDDEGLTYVALEHAASASPALVRRAMRQLEAEGHAYAEKEARIRGDGQHSVTYVWRLAPLAPPTDAPRLAVVVDNTVPPPGLREGVGPRHEDCEHFARCLGVLAKQHPGAVAGHCSEGCQQQQTEPAYVRLARAGGRRSSPIAQCEGADATASKEDMGAVRRALRARAVRA